MRKIILIAHISLDGFVADTEGKLDGFDPGEENLEYVCKLTEDADAALFGRISYQLLDNHWPGVKDHAHATKAEVAYSGWYNDAQKIVLSKTLPEGHQNKTTIIGENVLAAISNIKQHDGKNILVFGSPAVSQLLMQQDLIDGYCIFVNPVIFGKGIPLFNGSSEKIRLRLFNTKQFSNGEFALDYIVDR